MRSSVVFGLWLVVVALVLGRYRGRIIPAVCDNDADVDAAGGGGAKASAALPFAPHRAARAAAVVVRLRLLPLVIVADGRCWGLCDWRAILLPQLLWE